MMDGARRRQVRDRLLATHQFPQVPEGWGVIRFRFVFRESKERNGRAPVGEMLSVSGYRGVEIKAYEFEERRRLDEELEDYRVVRPGQLAVNTMWLNHRGLGVSRVLGHVSPAYAVYDISPNLDPAYAHYLLRSDYYLNIFKSYLYGIRPNSFQIKDSDWLSIPILVPPVSTQTAIADFLDRETARIDRIVHLKYRQSALLQERSGAIVQELLQAGLVSWTASTVRLRRFLVSMCDGPFGSGLKSEHYTTAGIRVIRLQNIGSDVFSVHDFAFIDPAYYATLGDHDVLPGDLLVAGLGDAAHPVGRACVAPADLGPAMVKADCFRLRFDPRHVSHRYVAKYLSSSLGSAEIGQVTKGVTRSRINLQILANLPITLPPVIEQERICNRIEAQTRGHDKLISRITNSIDQLLELRSALITAAVTGQIDVATWGRRGETDRRLEAIEETMAP